MEIRQRKVGNGRIPAAWSNIGRLARNRSCREPHASQPTDPSRGPSETARRSGSAGVTPAGGARPAHGTADRVRSPAARTHGHGCRDPVPGPVGRGRGGGRAVPARSARAQGAGLGLRVEEQSGPDRQELLRALTRGRRRPAPYGRVERGAVVHRDRPAHPCATSADIGEGLGPTDEIIRLLPRLRVIVLVGRKAQKVAPRLSASHPDIALLSCPHPSPQSLHPNPGNRRRILDTLGRSGRCWTMPIRGPRRSAPDPAPIRSDPPRASRYDHADAAPRPAARGDRRHPVAPRTARPLRAAGGHAHGSLARRAAGNAGR